MHQRKGTKFFGHFENFFIASDGSNIHLGLNDLTTVAAALIHGTTGHNDTRDVKAHCGEICTSNNVITGCKNDECVETVNLCNAFDRHRDDIPHCKLITKAY